MKEQLQLLLARYGQEHLLRFWDQLSPAQQRRLADDVAAVDLELVARLTRENPSQAKTAELADRAEPPPAVRPDQTELPFPREQARQRGEAALRAGQAGMILVAGGQGTRLGFDAPKGMYPIGPVSGRSLFQILIDRLLAVGRRYNARIPLYVMTSPATHDATIAYLNEHDRFGLPADDLHIFRQGVLPAVCAETGRVLMADRDALCLAPNGHGGMLEAFASSGALADVQSRGAKQLFYCQIDNPLAPCCDPEILGWSSLTGSEMTTLAVAKVDPLERVGNIVSIDGRVQILEYSELPPEAAARRNADGTLRFWAGSTAIHVFDVDFLARVADRPDALPYHRAKKVTPHIDTSGRLVTPSEPNSFKFERFIFDLLPLAENAIVIEAPKREIFAPVKNAPGDAADTPESAQAAMCDLHRRWLRAAGVEVADETPVEINPRFALDAEELAAKVSAGVKISEATYLED